jgi:hypothetical protein
VDLNAGDSITVDAACTQTGVPPCTIVNLCLCGAEEEAGLFDAAFDTLGVCTAEQTPALADTLMFSKLGAEDAVARI